MHLPSIALSVRQPWAWAIVSGGKPIENRSEAAVRNGDMRAQIGRFIAIHAAKGMTRDEYEDAREFMVSIGVTCPPPWQIERGGIVGTAMLRDIVKAHASPWFFGPRGLVLELAAPVPFVGAKGELGMFRWQPNDAAPDELARWMRQPAATPKAATRPKQLDLF